MTLSELGEEYLENSKKIREAILRLRPKLKILEGEERINLQRDLMTMYSIARDCRQIGDYLKNYYGSDDNDKNLRS